MQHMTIYREKGRYAGWPANYGIWSWGDEIVVGFTLGYYNASGGFHRRDRARLFVNMQARSLDGGLTWDIERTRCRTPNDRGFSADEHMSPHLGIGAMLGRQDALLDCPGAVDFTHPDFALMCARSGLNAGSISWFYLSTDRCHSWDGPFRLPMFNQPGISARTDYLVSGSRECMLFLTAAKSNGREGRVFCARTTDGGKSFNFVSWIGPEPEGYSIMPASVRLSESRILVAVRRREGKDGIAAGRCWIELYASDDDGSSWRLLNTPVNNTGMNGNPPALLRLHDGRLCMTYGYRDPPYGIRAKLSGDEGMTWGEEIILRDDGGTPDLGYPRTVQRPDGSILTAYYFADQEEGERYIAATLWETA